MNSIIDRKVMVSMLFLALTMLGMVSYHHLQVELLPNTELSTLYVRIQASSETDPKYIEQQAVVPLEGIVGKLENVESIESNISPGSATIMVSLSRNADVVVSYLKLIEYIQDASDSLPDDFSATVYKANADQSSNQFMRIQVMGKGSVDRIRNVIEQELSDRFLNIDGVASVEVYGGREKSVEIIVDEDLLDSYGITLGQIRQSISNQQSAKEYAGAVKDGVKNVFVTVEADYNSLSEIENIVIKDDGPIRLKDIAKVHFGVKEEDSFSRINGMEAVTMTLARESQMNLITVANKVLAEINEINLEFKSQGIELSVEYNSAETMQTNIDRIISLALTGGILAVFLLWVFLENIYLVFVAMIAIPVSVYSAFSFFYGAGVSINILTLLGLALAVGMLIDNNVVVMENIHRLSLSGYNLRQSVLSGTRQVWRSVTASTFTTITVFLPFVFSSNMIFREVAKHISVSIVATLLISLLTALILVPVLTLAFLRNRRNFSSKGPGYLDLHNRMVQLYIQLLKMCLRRPVAVITGVVVMLFVTVFISLAVSVNTSKETETSGFFLSVEMPSGSTLETTDQMVRELESRLSGLAEKPDIISQVNAETASVTIRLPEDYDESEGRSIGEIRQDIQSRIKDIQKASVTLSQNLETGTSRGMGISSSGGTDISKLFGIGEQTEKVVIKGEDFDKMLLVANDVEYFLEENLDDISSVNISTSSSRPEVHLGFDPLLMGIYNITPSNVMQELKAFQSNIESGGTFKINDESYDINIVTKGAEDEEKNMDDLTALQVESTNKGTVPLINVADISYAWGRSEIERVNQEKIIEVNYSFTDEVNESKSLLESGRQNVKDLIALVPIPSDVSVTLVQEDNPFEEFKLLMFVAILLIYMILASVFGSFSAPFVMMFTVPLAATGSLIALTLCGSSLLSLNTLVGFLILLGVVVNNGIILMDYSNQLRSSGTRPIRALIQAGISRIRPVTITAATTIIAMLPLAMGQTEYVGSLGAPFAITVIGGLSFSTVLTLVFVPTFAYGLDSALSWIYAQKRYVLIIMGIAWSIGLFLIFVVSTVSFVWQLIYLVLLIPGVPAVVWFVSHSLRQARGAGINEEDSIRISIRNLVKTYERPSRFTIEWQARRRVIARKQAKISSRERVSAAIWQIPLIGFAVYFIWFYVSDGIVLFTGTILFYITFPLFFEIGAGKFIKVIIEKYLSHSLNKWLGGFYRYGFPLFAGAVFLLRWQSLNGVIFVCSAWYLILGIFYSGRPVKRNNVQISAGKNWWNSLGRWYWRFIKQLPFVDKSQEPFKAVKSVSLEFKTGMIGLLGPNGAGKTTMMRIICGVLDQSYGKIFINSIDTTAKREELQGLIGYLPQEFGMYENMTAYAFLDYMALLKRIVHPGERKKRIEYVLNAVHMQKRSHETIGSYSGGMKQRIGIAMILLHLPRILVVDEPTAGLDPGERIRFRNLLVELSRERVVIFSTHIIEDISSSCNQVAVMLKGELKYYGKPSSMVQQAEGRVWQAVIEESDFDSVNRQYKIVHHIKTGDKIRIRCLSNTRPFDSAVLLKPLLEDAYLLMLQGNH
jgi:multidrug efflux pump subunit AcrB/ABC-type multidrug transport system ATPase subunit